MRNNTGDLTMGSKVINAVVSPPPSDDLEEPVEMTFEKNIVRKKIINENIWCYIGQSIAAWYTNIKFHDYKVAV